MHDWCEREDFRRLLPGLLTGEDEDFCRHILKVVAEAEAKQEKG